MYNRGIKFASTLYITTPRNNLPKVKYICCLGMLLDHLNLSRNFKMSTISFLLFTHELILFYKILWNIMENSMSSSRTIWVNIENTLRRFWKGNKICLLFFFFGLLTESHQSKTNINEFSQSICSNFLTVSSHSANYFVVKLRGFFQQTWLVKRKCSENQLQMLYRRSNFLIKHDGYEIYSPIAWTFHSTYPAVDSTRVWSKL